jgi:GxxExxY protein
MEIGNGDEDILALCDRVRRVAFELHTWLRHGHLVKVYENGLAHRLGKAGLEVEQQCPLQVRDADGAVLGDYFADLLVNRRLIIELKACKALADEHIAQVLGYLRASTMRHALLINFGAPRIQFKKLIL